MPFIEKHLGIISDGTNPISHGIGSLDNLYKIKNKDKLDFYSNFNSNIYFLDPLLKLFRQDSYQIHRDRIRSTTCPTQGYMLTVTRETTSRQIVMKHDVMKNTFWEKSYQVDYNDLHVDTFTNGDFVVLNQAAPSLELFDKNGVLKKSNTTNIRQTPNGGSGDVIVSSKRNTIAVFERKEGVIQLYDRQLVLKSTYTLGSDGQFADFLPNGDLLVYIGDIRIATPFLKSLQINYATRTVTGTKSSPEVASNVWRRYVGHYRDEIYYVLFPSSGTQKTLVKVNANLQQTDSKEVWDTSVSLVDVDDSFFYALEAVDTEAVRLMKYSKSDVNFPVLVYPPTTGMISGLDRGHRGTFRKWKGPYESYGRYW